MFETLKKLQVPFEKNFYNLPYEHYVKLADTKGYPLVANLVRELIVEYKDNEYKANKARSLYNKLCKNLLTESISEDDICECGFDTLGEEFEFCPVCNNKLIESVGCFYRNEEDSSCSLDGDDCKWLTYVECGKLK